MRKIEVYCDRCNEIIDIDPAAFILESGTHKMQWDLCTDCYKSAYSWTQDFDKELQEDLEHGRD